MRDADISLGRLSSRLEHEYGLHVSRTTISNWLHGRLPRRSHDDQRRTEGIEQLLKLGAGELTFRLERDRVQRKRTPPPAALTVGRRDGEEDPVHDLRDLMTKVGGSDAYSIVGVEERVLIGADRRESRRTVRLTLLALDEFTDCYRLIYTPDDRDARSEIEAVHNCRKGRETPGRDGLRGVELVFDQILGKREEYQFVYREVVRHVGEPQNWTRRGVGHSTVARLKTDVVFDTPPKQIWTCRWDERDDQPIDLVPVPVLNSTATLSIEHPPPGLHGLTWIF